MQLVLALFSIVVVGIENSFQKVYSDAEYLEDKCTVQSTDNYHTRLGIDLVNKLLVIYPIYRNYCRVLKHKFCVMVTVIKETQIRSECRIPFTDATSTRNTICTLDHLPLQTFHLLIKSLEF